MKSSFSDLDALGTASLGWLTDASAGSDTDILQAAREVVLQYGPRRASMDAVARKAGITRTTLYRKFADKSALLQALMWSESRHELHNILNELAPMNDPRQQLESGFVRTVQVAQGHPLVQQLHRDRTAQEWGDFLPVSLGNVLYMGTTLMAGIIRQLQSQGQWPAVDAEAVAEMLIRLWQSLVMLPTLESQDERISLMARQLGEMIFGRESA